MKKHIAIFVAFCIVVFTSFGQQTPFEKGNKNTSATYDQIIDWYKMLDAKSPLLQMKEMGETDAELPLHLVLINSENEFEPKAWRNKNKILILINNGIHAGEPDGIDASMMLARDIVNNKIKLPENVVLAIIPVYNIGGCLNRNSNSRVNQNGPVEYGFRGNSQNLDLNRDFIKCDSREAMSFARMFQFLDPDIFIDNHVSDGADYQHTMTLLTTQYDKLGGELGDWLKNEFEPSIYQNMKQKGWDLIPYVDFEFTDLNKGMTMFYDPPRYSSGYAALFNTLSFVPETHMLKPYAERVQSTYDLMKSFMEEASKKANIIIQKRKEAEDDQLKKKSFGLKWTPDRQSFSEITFKGYEKDSTVSEATGLQKYFYNHEKPFTRQIKYFNHYIQADTIQKPNAYIIPAGWHEVIKRLSSSGVKFEKLKKDTTIEVTAYHIDSYKSYPNPYEKHHKNYEVQTSKTRIRQQFRKGDYYIPMNQRANRYLIESLEPTGEDGFFAWNFFDAILQQKEGYSDYRWEDLAASILAKDSVLRQKLEEKKKNDPVFAGDSAKILDFIYKNSSYYEKVHLRYPVYRVE